MEGAIDNNKNSSEEENSNSEINNNQEEQKQQEQEIPKEKNNNKKHKSHSDKDRKKKNYKNNNSKLKFADQSNTEDSSKLIIQPHQIDLEFIKKADLTQIIPIFKSESEEEISAGIVYLKTFVQESRPTFIQLFDILDHIFKQESDLLEKSCYRMNKIMRLFSQQNANSIIYKTYFTCLQHYSVKIPQNEDNKEFYSTIPQTWRFVHLDSLATFLTIFDIKHQIQLQDVDSEVKRYMNEKKYQECVKVIANFENYADNLLPQLIEILCTNKDVSKAADLIKQFKLDPSLFPDVNIRLKKMCLRYNLRTYSWEFVAELFKEHKDILAYAVEDLIFNKQYNEAYSILQIDSDIMNYVTKKEVVEALNDKTIQFQILPNILQTKDSFNPSSENNGSEPKGTYINFSDFGITREKVYFIDNIDSNEFKFAQEELQNAKYIGIDGEFKPPITKLDNTTQSLALLQTATQNHCFLFDSVKLANTKEYLNLLKNIFENQNIIKLGHTLSGDISMVAQQLQGLLNVKCCLDLAKVHKAMYPKEKQSSLTFIAKLMLNKGLCKAEQTSNWTQRPLREAQIHYGAMDAYISIAIYNKYIQVFGQEEISKFIEKV